MKYRVHVTYPGETGFPGDLRHRTYECPTEDDVREVQWLAVTNAGKITWIGEKVNLGPTPNGKFDMYEYREIKEAYK